MNSDHSENNLINRFLQIKSSPLHYAVCSGNLSTVRLLLFAGAQVAFPSEQLNKPSSLDIAILQGNLPVIVCHVFQMYG